MRSKKTKSARIRPKEVVHYRLLSAIAFIGVAGYLFVWMSIITLLTSGVLMAVYQLVESDDWSWRHPRDLGGVALGLVVLCFLALGAIESYLLSLRASIESDGFLVIHRFLRPIRVSIDDISAIEIFADDAGDKRASMQILVGRKAIDLNLFPSHPEFIAALRRHNPSIAVRKF